VDVKVIWQRTVVVMVVERIIIIIIIVEPVGIIMARPPIDGAIYAQRRAIPLKIVGLIKMIMKPLWL
jgi:hypothetical protein